MKKIMLSAFALFITACSDAPKIVILPEPTDRVVLAELFTENN